MLATLLTAQPAQPAALRLMVQMLAARQRPREAITYVRAARRAAPDALALLVTEAALEAQAGDFAAAYRALEEAPLEQAQSPLLLERAPASSSRRAGRATPRTACGRSCCRIRATRTSASG